MKKYLVVALCIASALGSTAFAQHRGYAPMYRGPVQVPPQMFITQNAGATQMYPIQQQYYPAPVYRAPMQQQYYITPNAGATQMYPAPQQYNVYPPPVVFYYRR